MRSFFANLPAEHKSDGEILQITAIASARSGATADAIQLLAQAIQRPHAKPEYYSNLASLLAAAGNEASRRKVLEEGVRRFPGEESLPSALAELGLREGNGPAAEGLLARLSRERQIALIGAIESLYRQQGRRDDEERLLRRGLELDPLNPGFLNNLGALLNQTRRAAEAVPLLRKAAELAPSSAVILDNLGSALIASGDAPAARDAFGQALTIDPAYASAHYNLANLLASTEEIEAALAGYDRAIELAPGHLEALNNKGNLLKRLGRLPEASSCFRQLLALAPDHVAAQVNAATLLLQQGDLPAAQQLLEKAIARDGANAVALNNLGRVLQLRGQTSAAVEKLEAALAITPAYAEALANLANCLTESARAEEALCLLEKAERLDPQNAAIASNRLFTGNYVDGPPPEESRRQHEDWGRRFTLPLAAPASLSRRGDRLRLGFVSPDLRWHSVSFFLEPLLEGKTGFDAILYAELARPDDKSARLRKLADGWRDTVGRPAEVIARTVRDDGIDILIDLAGHSADNRLDIFALKPAPAQITWLGYPNTTGLGTIGWRITDAIADPPGYEAHATESLIRLPDGFLCYRPPEEAPVPKAAASPDAPLTFGSFNNIAKLSDRTIRLWSAVLRAVPGSRLVLKSRALADPRTGSALLARFASEGIDAGRLHFLGSRSSVAEHLASYAGIDIALDTVPYNGTTTTFEALWMGVPVVCLAGDRHAARVGASILSHLDLGQLIAQDAASFVNICNRLSENRAQLSGWRQGLRQKLEQSAFLNSEKFRSNFIKNLVQHTEPGYKPL
ncbi:tetratricopeptide repeat protein [Radicibacter daui]|uniref:tetratricopeptide repeat protein n=1 Tax=Radicibacter daui TaxID=3064829 RepID=UPI004046F718